MTGQILPLKEATVTVLSHAAKSGVPLKSMLYDATPQVKQMIASLYDAGFCLMALNGAQAEAACNILNTNKRADV